MKFSLTLYASAEASCYRVTNLDEHAYRLATQGYSDCYSVTSSDLRDSCLSSQQR